MSTDGVETVVKILGRTYHVKCARSEISALQNTAKQLEDRVNTARELNSSLDSDRITMIVALNLMNELLSLTQKHDRFIQSTRQKLSEIQNKVDDALTRGSQGVLISEEI